MHADVHAYIYSMLILRPPLTRITSALACNDITTISNIERSMRNYLFKTYDVEFVTVFT